MTDPHIPLGAACVYRLTHPESGKAYIGKTVKPLGARIRRHMRPSVRTHIGRALRKHGRDALRAEALLVGSEEYCFEMERALIAALGTQYPRGYNVTRSDEHTSELSSLMRNS